MFMYSMFRGYGGSRMWFPAKLNSLHCGYFFSYMNNTSPSEALWVPKWAHHVLGFWAEGMWIWENDGVRILDKILLPECKAFRILSWSEVSPSVDFQCIQLQAPQHPGIPSAAYHVAKLPFYYNVCAWLELLNFHLQHMMITYGVGIPHWVVLENNLLV